MALTGVGTRATGSGLLAAVLAAVLAVVLVLVVALDVQQPDILISRYLCT